jgi:hypothetical protein
LQTGADESGPFEPSQRDVDGRRGHLAAGAVLELGEDGRRAGVVAEPKRGEEHVVLEFAQRTLVAHGAPRVMPRMNQ